MRPMRIRHLVAALTLVTGFLDLRGNPTSGQVASGSASITTVPGTVTINQQSATTIINWQTFSIGAGELTKFVQPSSTSAALNRVLGGELSTIDGTLSANGQVYLINGNGIVVGPGGTVTASTFGASTRDISDADFLSGNLHFTGSNPNGVQNFGTINALGGDVYLIGKTVDNQGTINATSGTAGLASGDDVLLNLAGQEHVFVSASPTAASALAQTAVHNSGTINSATAELKAANGNLFALAINNEGTVRATSVAQRGGRIFLTTDAGTTQNTGTIAARMGQNGGQVKITGGSVWNRSMIDASGETGGSVSISSQNVQNDGTITVRGSVVDGGSVLVDFTGNALGGVTGLIDASSAMDGGSIIFNGTGANSEAYLSLKLNVRGRCDYGGLIDIVTPTLYLTGATLVADGFLGGGQIDIGQGDGNLNATATQARTTYVSSGTTLEADATSSGNGGQINVVGTQTSLFHGMAHAYGAGTHGRSGTVTIATLTGTGSGGGSTGGGGGTTGGGTGSTGGGVATGSGTLQFGSLELIDPDPGTRNAFGVPTTGVFNLASNTTVVTSPGDSFGGAGAGAVYLFSDTTGALLSTLRGSHPGDGVGTGIEILPNSRFVVTMPTWDNGTGAVTFGTGKSGFASGGGDVSSANSLIGSVSGDDVGSGGVQALFNGDYLVLSPNWNGTAGAVTWVDPARGVTGVVGGADSLVGATAGDAVGSGGVFELSNGANYLVLSPSWGGGRGAITNGSENNGVTGVVGTGNSLVGATTSDGVGTASSIFDTNSGYYLVTTPGYGNGAGAVTWNSDGLGTTGAISAANSLVGSVAGDGVGDGGITLLEADNNYVVSSPDWNGGAGAVTWGNGAAGVTGIVGGANSLVGSAAGDHVGSGGITALINSENFVVSSPDWDGQTGAVTLARDATGVTGFIGAANSLVGATNGDAIGSGGVTELDNGAIVVQSPSFDGGAGAVTWGSLGAGMHAVVGSANSLVGAAPGDAIGSGGIFQLSNGSDYLVLSPQWDGTKGAITEGSDSHGVSGIVSAANSLAGANPGDLVGATGSVIDPYSNYFLVNTPTFAGGAGAVTWSSDSSATVGVIGTGNSLVGSSASDHLGSGGVTVLYDGNYVVISPDWNRNAGAVTWGSASGGIVGTVSSANSLIGETPGDVVGGGGIVQLSNAQNYLVLSPSWHGNKGAITDVNSATGLDSIVTAGNSLVGAMQGDFVGSAGSVIDPLDGYFLVTTPSYRGGEGAVTWSDDSTATIGPISGANSLVGSATSDHVGSGGITILENDNYVVNSPNWNAQTGAVTWGNATGGVSGAVSSANSLVGSTAGDRIGSGGLTLLSDGDYLVYSPHAGGGAGALTWTDEDAGVSGVVGAGNSLVGTSLGDNIGSGGIEMLPDGNYLVISPLFGGRAGAVTWGSESSGVFGDVGAGNSLVGAANNDEIGNGGVVLLSNGSNYLVLSPSWNGGAGAVTNGSDGSGIKGIVSSANSLVGGASGDSVGTSGSILDSQTGYYFVLTPAFNGNAGAVTWNADDNATKGIVSAANSLVGTASGDHVGSGGITFLTGDNNFLVSSPDWDGDAGAVSWGSGASGIHGTVGAANSLVGGAAGDAIGNGGITLLANGSYLVTSSSYDGGAGAVTFGLGSTGASGIVGASNSLVGASATDSVGSGGITFLRNGNYLVYSPEFDGGAGAVTFGSATTGVFGTAGVLNSLVGANSDDHIGTGGIILLPNGNYLVQSPFFNQSAGAVTWGSATIGVSGQVGSLNSLVGGVADAGEEFAGFSADGSVYFVSFTTDTSLGGDGRVVGGSVDGPLPEPAVATTINPFTTQPVVTFEVAGFNQLYSQAEYFISDPAKLGLEPVSVDTLTDGAVNDGSGKNIASQSSTSHLSGPQRLVTPRNGVWNIFGGTVHSEPAPTFVLQQLQLNLNPEVYAHLNDLLFGHP